MGKGPENFLRRFLDSLSPLGSLLGCILLQFPPDLERDDEGLDDLLAALPEELRFACEFRHPSWEEPAVPERLAERRGTLCLVDTEGSVPSRLPPGPIAYVRLRASRYGDDDRTGWLQLLQQEAETRDVYAFAKHEGVPAGDPFVGVGLAQWLAERTGVIAPR
jgi:uncharacterized protein YecE (DUF72 family)